MEETKIIYDIGSIVDWVSAIGTVGALFYAIYLTTRDSGKKLKIQIFNDKFRHHTQENDPNTYEFCLTNIRPRSIHIRSYSFYVKHEREKVQLGKSSSSEKVFIRDIAYGQMEIVSVPIDARRLSVNLGVPITKLPPVYVEFEDIDGKKFKKKFYLNT